MSDSSGGGFLANEGDVLVVSYPEVKLPIAGSRYAMVSVGGLIYTRKLREGDDVQAEHDRIYGWLRTNAERSAREKLEAWAAELAGSSAPKPAPRAAAPMVPKPGAAAPSGVAEGARPPKPVPGGR